MSGRGTGLFAAEMSQYCQVTGVDDHEEAISLARRRQGADVRSGAVQRPSLSGRKLRRLHGTRRARTPSRRPRRTQGDEPRPQAEGNRRRHRPGVHAALERVGRRAPSPASLSAVSSRGACQESRHGDPHLPIHQLGDVHADRRYRKLREWTPLFRGGPRAEDKVPGPAVNRMLEATFVGPACQRWFFPPFGVSVLAVLRKKA